MVQIVTPRRHFYTAPDRTLTVSDRVSRLEQQIEALHDALDVYIPLCAVLAETASHDQRKAAGQLLMEHYRNEPAKIADLRKYALEMLGLPPD